MQIPRKMSAQNMMASISRTLGTRHEVKGANEIKFAGEESKDRLYEPKHKQKLVRVLTVVAYIISVSLAAIVLSLYYMYIWDPSDHRKFIAKQRLAEASKTPCPEIVTPAVQTEITASLAQKYNGTLSDAAAAVAAATASTPDSSEVFDDASPRLVAKSLYKMLTSPASLRDVDYSSSTDLPQIFPAVPRANDDNDYHDATIAPVDDLLDD